MKYFLWVITESKTNNTLPFTLQLQEGGGLRMLYNYDHSGEEQIE